MLRGHTLYTAFFSGALILTVVLSAFLFYFVPLPWWGDWLIAINLVTAFYYTLDKLRAIKQGYRVPEKMLLSLGFLGGTPAAFLSMLLLRHKTRKTSYQWQFAVVTVIQLILVYIWLF